MPDRSKDVLDFDDDEPSSQELQEQVERARTELEELRRRSEQIERDKQRLEELSRKQDEFETGKSELLDKFMRAAVVIQRETQEAEKRLDQLHAINEAFASHQRSLESINPKAWVGLDLAKELSKALSVLDEARSEYQRSQPKLALDPVEDPRAESAYGSEYEEYDASEKGFFYWLKTGFAFTFPLLVVSVLALLVWIWSLSAK